MQMVVFILYENFSELLRSSPSSILQTSIVPRLETLSFYLMKDSHTPYKNRHISITYSHDLFSIRKSGSTLTHLKSRENCYVPTPLEQAFLMQLSLTSYD